MRIRVHTHTPIYIYIRKCTCAFLPLLLFSFCIFLCLSFSLLHLSGPFRLRACFRLPPMIHPSMRQPTSRAHQFHMYAPLPSASPLLLVCSRCACTYSCVPFSHLRTERQARITAAEYRYASPLRFPSRAQPPPSEHAELTRRGASAHLSSLFGFFLPSPLHPPGKG